MDLETKKQTASPLHTPNCSEDRGTLRLVLQLKGNGKKNKQTKTPQTTQEKKKILKIKLFSSHLSIASYSIITLGSEKTLNMIVSYGMNSIFISGAIMEMTLIQIL